MPKPDLGFQGAAKDELDQIEGAASFMHRITSTLNAGKEFQMRCSDDTMQPYIQPGDMLIFLSTTFEKVKIGDFAMYKLTEGGVAVKRIVTKKFVNGNLMFVARPDGQPLNRDEFKSSQLMARLAFIERHGKRIKGSALNRGLIDQLTHYGTRSVQSVLTDAIMSLLGLKGRV